MAVSDLLNLTCTLTPKTITVDTSSGQNDYASGSAVTSVPCAVQTRQGNSPQTYQTYSTGRETGVTEFIVYFKPDQTVDVDYTISAIAGGSGYAGAWASKTLGVTSLWADGVGRGQYKMVTARLVDGGPTP